MASDKIQQIGIALARIPSGCAILTVRDGERRTGMLASWFQQAAFEPPMVTVAVRKGRASEKLIEQAGGFVLNLLGETPGPMFKHFGKGFAPDEDAFAGLPTMEAPYGVKIADQVACLSAKVRGRYDAGDHWVYVGEVVEATANADARPYVHLRKNGLSY
jgi:flavin reductase (DIM6/NTAB) family NADH-FMN oxidoreductase RutF